MNTSNNALTEGPGNVLSLSRPKTASVSTKAVLPDLYQGGIREGDVPFRVELHARERICLLRNGDPVRLFPRGREDLNDHYVYAARILHGMDFIYRVKMNGPRFYFDRLSIDHHLSVPFDHVDRLRMGFVEMGLCFEARRKSPDK